MACRSLSGITKGNCDSNKGGLYTTVWVTNRSNFDLGEATDGVLAPQWISGKTAEDSCTLKFRKQSSGLTSEGTFDDANGISFFTNNLALVFARQDINKRLAIQALSLQEDLAVIVRDANGVNYFMGYDDSVTATAAGAQTGTAATDPNQYTITLTDISNELPYIVADTTMATLFGADWKNAEYPTPASND